MWTCSIPEEVERLMSKNNVKHYHMFKVKTELLGSSELPRNIRTAIKQALSHLTSGHLIGCRKKMEYNAEIFSNIMRKKVTIMRKIRQIMRRFLTSYREFNSFMTCLTFCCHSWTGISSFTTGFPIFVSKA